jgi:hypothetical protein
MKKGIQNLQVSFGESSLTHFGGMFLIQWFCKKLKIKELLHSNVRFSNQYIKYHPVELIIIIIYAIIVGILRLTGTKILKYNGSFQKILGLKTFPHPTRLNRFIISLDRKTLQAINRIHNQLLLQMTNRPYPRTSLIFDLDSTVLTVYGKLEGAKIGYNPHKHGRPSYQPLLCFEAHTKDYWHGEFRSGDTHVTTGAVQFLQECFAKIPPGIYRIRVRADAGFYDHYIVEFLDEKQVGFVIVAKITKSVKEKLPGLQYRRFKEGHEIAEFKYQPHGWKKPYRFIIERRLLPKETNQQPTLFTMNNYSYRVMVTNLDIEPEYIWYFYNGRCRIELIIKELKEDYPLGKIPTKYWNANESFFHLLLFAYNIVNWFKRLCLPKELQHFTLRTIRTEFLVVPAKLVKTQNKNLLKLPRNYVYQKAFLQAMEKIQKMK